MCNNPVIEHINTSNIKLGTRKRPCGQCLGCRIDSLLLWSNRCNSELVKSRSAFVTFTYDDNHLPYFDSSSLFPSLRRNDLHRYLDSLRHYVKDMKVLPYGCKRDFHYFACGEYGDTFQRPHYHILFFGLDFADCKKIFNKSWKNGSIKILPILQGGVRYVVDYMSKNLNGDMAVKEYDERKRERPFVVSSRGLGFDYFYAHRDEISRTGKIRIGSRTVNVPSYYKNLFSSFGDDFDVKEELQLETVKKMIADSHKLGFVSYDDYLKYECRALELRNSEKMRQNGKASKPLYIDYAALGDKQLAYDAFIS